VIRQCDEAAAADCGGYAACIEYEGAKEGEVAATPADSEALDILRDICGRMCVSLRTAGGNITTWHKVVDHGQNHMKVLSAH
jgi:hypothetical protein